MSLIRLERVSFAYRDSVPILDQVDLQLPDGWSGLVGENGAGKTTLLRLLASELAPDLGRIHIEPAGALVALCQQVLEESGPEILALAERVDGEARRLMAQLNLDVEGLSRWSTLSPGQRKRWQVGAASETTQRATRLAQRALEHCRAPWPPGRGRAASLMR